VAATSQQTQELPRGLVVLIAVATGAVVANLYYAQPVLHQVARTFNSGPGATSTIITATQIGYAAGLLLVVPLGDLHPRRGLVSRLFCVSAVALIGCAVAPNLWVFAVASILVGGAFGGEGPPEHCGEDDHKHGREPVDGSPAVGLGHQSRYGAGEQDA
jgi:MFS family permease